MPSSTSHSPESGASTPKWFATTHWSVVLSAGEMDSARAFDAVEKLCRIYWQPIFNFVRRQGYNVQDAQDLTQGFFAKLLEKNFWARANPEKGRFRSFLLTALCQYLADQRDRANAAKRGGGVATISLEEEAAEGKAPEAAGLSSEEQFDRQWAQTVLEQARTRLREECVASGKLALYESLDLLSGNQEKTLTYADLAARLGMSMSALKSAVSRLRDRYGELVREEVAQTVANPAELDAEIAYLRSILST